MPNCSGLAGGALMHRAVHPLDSCGLCRPVKVPSGSPSLSFRTSMRKLLIIRDFCTNGLTSLTISDMYGDDGSVPRGAPRFERYVDSEEDGEGSVYDDEYSY